MTQRKKLLPTLSLFSGGGGMDLGFAVAGYSLVASIDIDPFSCKTLELNSRKRNFLKEIKILDRDITKTPTSQIINLIGLQNDNIDVVIGGPPCQAFSVFGKRGGINDPRGNLVWEYLRIIKDLNPTAFIFENVAGLKTIHNGSLYNNLLEALSCDGKYAVSDHTYELADFGIPQYRRRVFFIGCKKGIRIPQMNPTHGEEGTLLKLRPFVTVGKVLNRMPEPGDALPNHIGREHSDRIIERYRNLKYGERDHKTRINKLHPERPSFTIIVGSDAGGGKGHIHPFSPREVTPRESARIQTFPDWWEFYGTGRHVIRQVGNAVPPLFAALLAEHIKKFVFGHKKTTTYEQFINRLGLRFLK